MAGKAVSYQFLDALAKSVAVGADTVKQAPTEINQLQTQTQALELAAQGDYLTSTVFTRGGDGRVSLTKNGQLCVTGTTVFIADVPINTPINTLAFDNALKIRIPCLAFWGSKGNEIHTEITFIDENGFLNSGVSAPIDSKIQIIITPGIYPIFANKE